MVTHDPVAAGYADRVLFLADGRIVDEMTEPTAERVLDRMKGFDARHQPAVAAPDAVLPRHLRRACSRTSSGWG